MSKKVARSANVVEEIIMNSPKLRELVAKDPTVLKVITEAVVKYLPTPAFVSSSGIYVIVVASLGLVSVSAVVGTIWLSIVAGGNFNLPETVTALGSAAIGALAGLLSPSPGSEK